MEYTSGLFLSIFYSANLKKNCFLRLLNGIPTGSVAIKSCLLKYLVLLLYTLFKNCGGFSFL